MSGYFWTIALRYFVSNLVYCVLWVIWHQFVPDILGFQNHCSTIGYSMSQLDQYFCVLSLQFRFSLGFNCGPVLLNHEAKVWANILWCFSSSLHQYFRFQISLFTKCNRTNNLVRITAKTFHHIYLSNGQWKPKWLKVWSNSPEFNTCPDRQEDLMPFPLISLSSSSCRCPSAIAVVCCRCLSPHTLSAS